MKFLLNNKYGLRGWLKMPRVLVDIENNHAIQTLTSEQFFILQNCNGEVDLQMNDIYKSS